MAYPLHFSSACVIDISVRASHENMVVEGKGEEKKLFPGTGRVSPLDSRRGEAETRDKQYPPRSAGENEKSCRVSRTHFSEGIGSISEAVFHFAASPDRAVPSETMVWTATYSNNVPQRTQGGRDRDAGPECTPVSAGGGRPRKKHLTAS